MVPKRAMDDGRDPMDSSDESVEDGGSRDGVDLSEDRGSEEDGEDLFGDNMERDYREIPHLDEYDSSQVDDAEYDPLPIGLRRMVDMELDRRDGRNTDVDGMDFRMEDSGDTISLSGSEADEDAEEERGEEGLDRMGLEEEIFGRDVFEMDLVYEGEESRERSMRELVMIESYRRRISRDLEMFLRTCVDEQGYSVYQERIRDMCSNNRESLEVSYAHVVENNAFLAKLLANCPREVLKIFDEVAMKVVLESFPEYNQIKSEIHVRMTNVPAMDNIRDLRYSHLNRLVRVSGVVTRRTGVFPQLKVVRFECKKCGAILGPFTQDLNEEIRVGVCSSCESRGPFVINDALTVYRNYQKITLQESPGNVPAGRLPRHKDVVLLWDLMDSVRPGEEIEVTGIFLNNYSYTLNNKNGFPVFATMIEANYIHKKDDQFMMLHLTDDDVREIKQLAKDPKIGKRIFKSIAPSIYGHEFIKTAIGLALFGGQPKNIQGKMNIRGDINVLMLGDPGTAKSQFLKYVEKTGLRAVYTTGQGASAVGLTACVVKDPMTREWTLEGGALVLADKGVCLIDEFDKMNDADRTSIHEAMEQQSISISKAGIVTTLQARCAVIAAANPIRGRYNSALAFSQNVNLTDPILSRFDVLCVVRDNIDPVIDQMLARFVVNSHMRSVAERMARWDGERGDDGDVEPLSQDVLRKYLMYAKRTVHPVIRNVDVDKISGMYSELRKESISSGGIPITVRHLESIVRMAEASARMHLRGNVTGADIDLGIRMVLESFISSQKMSIMKRLTGTFSRYLTKDRDVYGMMMFTLQEIVRENLRYQQDRQPGSEQIRGVAVKMDEFESRLGKTEKSAVERFYGSQMLARHGFRIDVRRRVIEYEMQ